ncbi:hypothetical protein INT43_001546 [Umbelopsis isabellina]|uniref:CCDC174 alpha/beta GRSR domain-containing protein n=1 Tax=Mortierella isabellina TaxID=91625 RepID=A0A8H7PEA4_MORIS|nr:hypothetical protein INT43_001546 [Umbelopsis isabellina]
MPKSIDVSQATALDLRAQLASQRESFDLDRRKGKQVAASERRHNKKPTVWARQNKGVSERAGKDKVELEAVAGPTLEASRAALQRKAKLYDQMRKRRRYNDDDNDENNLIDFDRQPLSSDEEDEGDDDDRSDTNDPWVDYVDEYGRTRTVRQSQVPKPRSPSPDYTPQAAYPVFTQGEETSSSSSSRRREEADEEVKRYDANQEIRAKGVGFYAFSKDEDERKAQMEELKQLRQQTEKARTHTVSVAAKRKQTLENNAAKINARRLLLKQKAAGSKAQAASPSSKQPDINEDSVSSFLRAMRNRS